MKHLRLMFVSLLLGSFALPAVQAFPIVGKAPSRFSLSSVGTDAELEISTCIASNPNLLVQIVVDESLSLKTTDPNNVRASVIADTVTSLGQIANGKVDGEPRRVMISLDAFAVNYRSWIDWTNLNSSSTQKLSDRVRREMPKMETGAGTDHRAALKGARQHMAVGVSRMGASQTPCRMVMMFTDGKLDVSDGAGNPKAIQDLCNTHGIMQGLRSDQVSVVSVLLFDPKFNSGGIGPRDRAFLQSLSEGRGHSGGAKSRCGTISKRNGDYSGLYLEGNSDELSALFAGTIAKSSGGTEITGLNGSPVYFYVDNGVTHFQLIAAAPHGGVLKGPDGQAYSFSHGQDLGAPLTTTWAGNTVTVTTPISSPTDLGRWTFSRPGQDDRAYLYYFSDLALDMSGVKELVAQQETKVSGVVARNGQPVDLTAFSSDRTFTADAIGPDNTATPVDITLADDGTFSGKFTPPEGVSVATFRLTLKLKTKPSSNDHKGQQLADIVRNFDFPVTLSAEFPTVSPKSGLQLSNLVYKMSRATGTLNLQGSQQGSTEVCAGPIAPPRGAPSDTFKVIQNPSAGSCITLGPGEKKRLKVSFDFGDDSKRVEGQYQGQIPLTLKVQKSGAHLNYAVPYTFASVVPFNMAKASGIAILLMVLSILIPLLILNMLNRRAARLSLAGLQMARVPVEITTKSGAVSLRRIATEGTSHQLLTPDDFQYISSELSREKSWPPGSERITASAPKNPFGAVTAAVTPLGGESVVSLHHPVTVEGGAEAGSPLNLQGFMYLLLNTAHVRARNDDQLIQAQLIAFIKPSITGINEQVTGLSQKAQLGESWDRGIAEVAAFEPPATKPTKAKKTKRPNGEAASPSTQPVDGAWDSASSPQLSTWDTPSQPSAAPDAWGATPTQTYQPPTTGNTGLPSAPNDDPWAL